MKSFLKLFGKPAAVAQVQRAVAQPKVLATSELAKVGAAGPNGTWAASSSAVVQGPNGTW